MDFTSLEMFVEVATAGGFNRAASKLHIAQSAISRRIARLEHDLGAQLLVRTKRGVRLTPAGALLLERSRALLRHYRQVQSEMLAEASEPRGELAIGLPPSLNRHSAVLLRALRELYPLLFVRTWVATSVDLRTMLLAGKLDLAVYATSEEDRLLTTQPLFSEALRLVGPPGGVDGSHGSWDAIAGLPLILTSRPNSLRLLVDAAAARHHCRLSVVMEVNDVYLLTDLAEQGAGFTILPSSAVGEPRAGRVSSVELPPAALSWVVAHSGEKPLSVAAERAISLIRETFAAAARRP